MGNLNVCNELMSTKLGAYVTHRIAVFADRVFVTVAMGLGGVMAPLPDTNKCFQSSECTCKTALYFVQVACAAIPMLIILYHKEHALRVQFLKRITAQSPTPNCH